MTFVEFLTDFINNYELPKYVVLKHRKLKVIYLLLNFLVLTLIIGIPIFLLKGYEETEEFAGQAYLKLKGNSNSTNGIIFDIHEMSPFKFSESEFVVTNYYVTYNQTKSICIGTDNEGKAPAEISEVCGEDGTCLPDRITVNGISTGECDYDYEGKKMCKIYGWCPVELDDKGKTQLLGSSGNVTLFIRVDGIFPSYPNNPISSMNNDALIWNYNLFYISDLVAYSQGYPIQSMAINSPIRPPMSYFDSVKYKGNIIQVYIVFNCNLWASFEKCKPFVEVRDTGAIGTFSSGQNFRYAKYYKINNIDVRDLYKLYGIRIEIHVQGIGRKISFYKVLITLGTSIGYFTIVKVLLNFVLHHCYKKRNKIQSKSTELVNLQSFVNRKNTELDLNSNRYRSEILHMQSSKIYSRKKSDGTKIGFTFDTFSRSPINHIQYHQQQHQLQNNQPQQIINNQDCSKPKFDILDDLSDNNNTIEITNNIHTDINNGILTHTNTNLINNTNIHTSPNSNLNPINFTNTTHTTTKFNSDYIDPTTHQYKNINNNSQIFFNNHIYNIDDHDYIPSNTNNIVNNRGFNDLPNHISDSQNQNIFQFNGVSNLNSRYNSGRNISDLHLNQSTILSRGGVRQKYNIGGYLSPNSGQS